VTTSLVVCVLISIALLVAIRVARRPRRRRPPVEGVPRVVIVGGGFAGVYLAKELEKLNRGDFEVDLINDENYFVFQPMLPEVISGSIGILDTVSPLRRLLPETHIHVRDVESIDLQNRRVKASPGYHPHPHVLPWDHLVLATGTVTDFRGLPGLPEHALPFKNLADALQLRSQVIHALEEAAIETDDPELRRQLLTFAVAGGGFSGVEVVAELNDFVREVAQQYRGIRKEEIRVVLLHSQDRILPEMPAKLGVFAQKILQERGVEVMLNVRLAAATGQEAVLSNGARIPSKTLVSTVPSSPHPLIGALPLPKVKGRIEVDGHLRVKDHSNVWAVGDCAQVPVPGGATCPPTAQHATRQARTAARNIVAAIRGGQPQVFDFKGLGKMGSLGRRNAVAEIFGVSISGFLAWFLWRTIYLAKLPGWGRRAKVAAAWTFDLVLPPELVQLNLSGSSGLSKEHFEPGQTVFSEGDLGDRIYIVLSGRAEVLRRVGGIERPLAKVGPGEYFGEMALLSAAPRNATVRCVEAMDVLSIPKREFGMLSANLPDLRSSFERVMTLRSAAR
jgi:NADH dehydrogenase